MRYEIDMSERSVRDAKRDDKRVLARISYLHLQSQLSPLHRGRFA